MLVTKPLPGVIVPVTSGGTLYSVNVAEPVVVFGGSTVIVYVPVLGSARVSTKPPPVPKRTLPPTAFPFGSRSCAVADE